MRSVRLAGVVSERREDSQAFFGRMAGQWDELRSELFGSRFTALGLLRLLPREWVVADLGCGTGNVAELLSPVVAKVIAVDRSPAMLAAAKKRLSGVRNVELVEGSLTALPLADKSVDAALSVLVLHHVSEVQDSLREMRRILRPGGIGLVIDMVEHDRESYRHTMGHKWQGFGEKPFAAMMTGAGFAGVKVDELAADPDGRGPGLFICTGRAGTV